MKMLQRRNLLENIIILSNCGTLICIVLHFLTDISLLTGIWFPIYITVVFVLSIFFSFKIIQWLLRLNKPIVYDPDAFVAKYPYLACVRGFLPELPKRSNTEWKEYDTNDLSVISTVLERKLVSSWYVPYISEEIGFPFACKQMLDQMIGKAFQICSNIETKDIFVDICTILSLHIKEYEKAVKRHEKLPSSSIESLYKKSHAISQSDQKYTSVEHCTNILRIIIKELLPWELRDTPHSELLVRILSKKLDNYIESTLADPAWLNDQLMTYLTGEEYIESKMDNIINDVDRNEEESSLKAAETSPEDVSPKIDTVEECHGKVEDEVQPSDIKNTMDYKDVTSSPVLRQKRGRQGRNEVKIYDRIIEGSVKTWETDMDLQCISLGQDLLASLDGEITLSRLWGHEEGSPEPGGKSPQLWAGEEDALELELPSYSPPSSHVPGTMVTHNSPGHDSSGPGAHASPGPHVVTAPGILGIRSFPCDVPSPDTPPPRRGLGGASARVAPSPAADAILKDLQTTVSQAKTKIGDLQVKGIDVSNGASDEAAGMMEGLLDLGIAGLKKGLRFTGLSDDSQEKCARDRSADKSPPGEGTGGGGGGGARDEQPPHHAEEALYMKAHVGAAEDNVSGAPPLLKQHRVTSQDSVPSQPRAIPFPPESPEPQYEEAADLSTSIAKLRRLLRQRAEAQPRGEEVWWDSAEETLGRAQQHASSRPVDSAALADEFDMSLERNSPNQTTNNMHRLDKLFQRTVTGVFNSLKTAVGGDEPEMSHAQPWAYVYTNNELSVCVVAARLAWSRRARGIEPALDSLQMHRPAPPRAPPTPDDLEEWVGGRARAWCAGGDAVRALRSHVAHRLASLLLADVAESLITYWLEGLSTWLREQIFLAFSRMEGGATVHTETTRPLNVDHTCHTIMDKMPAMKVIFGEEALSVSVHRAVSSLSHKEPNRDVAFRLLDLVGLRFSRAAAAPHADHT